MTNTPEQQERLVAAVSTAHRPRDPLAEGIAFHPNWYDLDEAGRRQAHEATRLQRRLEAGLDPDNLSTTARAVLARIAAAEDR